MTRGRDKTWILTEAGPGQSLPIPPIEVSLAVDEVYDDPLASA